MQARIAHISDLHFGRTDPIAVNALRDSLERLELDLIVATGDFTQSGRRREFEEAAAFLKSLSTDVVAVPGNHDVPVYNLFQRFYTPWHRYKKTIGLVATQDQKRGSVVVFGLNSARRAAPRLNWSYGKVRQRDLDRIYAQVDQLDADAFLIVAAHHPFEVSVGRSGKYPVVGHGKAVNAFADAGIDCVLTGHVHVARVKPLDGSSGRILSIQSGSATSVRQRGEPASFLMLETTGGLSKKLSATVYALDGGSFQPGAEICFEKDQHTWHQSH